MRSQVWREPQASHPYVLARLQSLRAPQARSDSERKELLLPSNSQQRKRECWPADIVAADARNGRDGRREIDSSVSTDERGGERSLRKTSSPNSGTRPKGRR